MPQREPVEVVIPLRWDAPGDVGELAAYLKDLSQWADVTVVDGSPDPLFDVHASAWAPHARHIRPQPLHPGRFGHNAKVDGAMTGVRQARHELVVLADDDVRYDERALRQLATRLNHADLVRPANVFSAWPWHARWDGARTLLNRAVAADWPGTFGVRRSVLLRTAGWDRDVMFENLELVRTVRAAGGRVVDSPEILVRRRPPEAVQFRNQRVRQAYDDLAQPWRLAAALATVPAAVLALRRRPIWLLTFVLGSVAVAEAGRRRAGARTYVPADVPLFAPLWVLERGVCSWLAVAARLLGGVRYRGKRLRLAANSMRTLRRRHADAALFTAPGRRGDEGID
ncbi:MAG TPA: glycosyltransferase family 2 protein [Actinomycetales bacterium]|nr:glycosyltransferase family 2 protein [Actinomycetales bacterium]